MLFTLLPVLSVFSRILLAFAPAFLVPLAWAWFLDARHHALVWAYGFAFTTVCGLILWRATHRFRRELQAMGLDARAKLCGTVINDGTSLPQASPRPGGRLPEERAPAHP